MGAFQGRAGERRQGGWCRLNGQHQGQRHRRWSEGPLRGTSMAVLCLQLGSVRQSVPTEASHGPAEQFAFILKVPVRMREKSIN